MKIIFAGTPEFAACALLALNEAGHQIKLVLTQPDRPAGRGMKLVASAVKAQALKLGLPVSQPLTLKTSAAQEEIAAVAADVMVVAAYGLILPPAVLALPRLGCLNIHASLLPRWRGAAPIQRAILAGDRETGITIMQMDAGLDTGAMLHKAIQPIAADDSAQSLHDKLAALGAASIVTALALLEQGGLPPERQDEAQATYAAKLTKEEGRMDWRQDAESLALSVRAYNPFPVAHFGHAGEVWRIWQASARNECGQPGEILRADKQGILVACGKGALLLTEIQKSGGKRLSAAQILAGHPLTAGGRFA
jgi:methionyl-tRNA formyltransferase